MPGKYRQHPPGMSYAGSKLFSYRKLRNFLTCQYFTAQPSDIFERYIYEVLIGVYIYYNYTIVTDSHSG